ncbi:hypothetical protein SDC9_108218 [bioreactor metagenome]|uniref:Uncharacterized protein n=1 Tax=bioreactor metagenome TaxID=1076179 RepID=A0A645B7D3_9ZZZZ
MTTLSYKIFVDLKNNEEIYFCNFGIFSFSNNCLIPDKDYQAVIILSEIQKQKSQKNTMKFKELFVSTLLITISIHALYCDDNSIEYFDCFVQLKDDVLTVGNAKIETVTLSTNIKQYDKILLNI